MALQVKSCQVLSKVQVLLFAKVTIGFGYFFKRQGQTGQTLNTNCIGAIELDISQFKSRSSRKGVGSEKFATSQFPEINYFDSKHKYYKESKMMAYTFNLLGIYFGIGGWLIGSLVGKLIIPEDDTLSICISGIIASGFGLNYRWKHNDLKGWSRFIYPSMGGQFCFIPI